MRYFIASRWENMKQVQYLTENLHSLGHEIFSYVSDSRNFVSQKELAQPKESFAQGDNWRTRPALKGIFEHDMGGLTGCDTFILLLPAGESSHIQAGIAYALGKHTVLIGEPAQTKSHYLIFSEWHKSIEEYITALRQGATTTHA